jgi:hypothetical protein
MRDQKHNAVLGLRRTLGRGMDWELIKGGAGEMKKTCKVVIVEDDKGVQQVLSELFSGEGLSLRLSGDGR